MNGELKQFNDEFEALAEKHGIVDFFMCGFNVLGEDVSNAKAGEKGVSNSNRQRMMSLIGQVEVVRQGMIQDLNENTISDEDQP